MPQSPVPPSARGVEFSSSSAASAGWATGRGSRSAGVKDTLLWSPSKSSANYCWTRRGRLRSRQGTQREPRDGQASLFQSAVHKRCAFCRKSLAGRERSRQLQDSADASISTEVSWRSSAALTPRNAVKILLPTCPIADNSTGKTSKSLPPLHCRHRSGCVWQQEQACNAARPASQQGGTQRRRRLAKECGPQSGVIIVYAASAHEAAEELCLTHV